VDDKAALLEFLESQRAAVLEIIDGLDDDALTTAVLPSNWTPLGMIEHLGYAERHWFQRVLTGSAVDVPWPDDDHEPLTTPRPKDTVFGFYQEQRERANAIIAATPLDALAKAWRPGRRETADLRWIMLHMIEETARHAGHLDVARELLDGSTGLAPR
jgi:uncharacterized damage-inducible protein DinB